LFTSPVFVLSEAKCYCLDDQINLDWGMSSAQPKHKENPSKVGVTP